jgi:Domain of unknown function (DUF4133)
MDQQKRTPDEGRVAGLPVYTIHRGVDRPLEFKGLQGTYIGRLAALAIGVLVGFGLLHWLGVNAWLGIVLVLGGGGLGVMRLQRLSQWYGPHGRMKRSAQMALPLYLRCFSRKAFIQLYSDGTGSA